MSPPADNTAASSVGERLKAARDRQGFTLQKVSEDLHLDLWILEAMEENRFRALGAPVYARGHLRKYAQLLGLDVDSVLADYEATHAGPVPPSLVPHAVENAAIVPELEAATSRYTIGAIAAGVLLVVAAGLWWWYVRPHQAAVRDPASGVVAARSETDAVHATVPPGVAADRTADAQATGLTATPPVAKPAVTGSKTATHPAPRPTAQTAEASDSTTPLAIPADSSVARLRLRFSADSWVEIYDASGTRLLYDERVADSARTVVGVPPFKVLLGNYPGVELSLDGKPVTVPERARYGATARFRVLPGGSTLASWGS